MIGSTPGIVRVQLCRLPCHPTRFSLVPLAFKAMVSTSRQQPPWHQPDGPSDDSSLPPLKIWNSLTRAKTPFLPINKNAKSVTWYACGPTVYDDAHLGHARTYLTSDIIRRIMGDYFEFDVRYVMNITDVDDKIIYRARQQHLLSDFQHNNSSQLPTLKEALLAYASKNLQYPSSDANPAAIHTSISASYADLLERNTKDDAEAKLKMHVKTTLAAARAITALEAQTDAEVSSMQDSKELDDVMMSYLDAKHGDSVDAKNHAVFTKLTKRHEDRFMEDMRALNVRDPDDVTRVTEYVPRIVDFITRIQGNGFAYQVPSGVYFDVAAFEKANNHYARLEPWNRHDEAKQAEGEGAITEKELAKNSDKGSNADFALWKISKPGEPSWPSPWGDGRPGWHIECSAMASDKLGSQFDIHSGGIDLAFPHHDNELAQSEAYWADNDHQKQHQWVNYFMHMGHLSIAGAKMSKSLKNFTTIREALSQGAWTSRGLRIVLLLGGWREGIEITDDLVKAGSGWEDKVNNFFIRSKDLLGDSTEEKFEQLRIRGKAMHMLPKNPPSLSTANGVTLQTNGDTTISLDQTLERIKSSSYLSLCDSFNTAAVMASISELITAYNTAEPPPSSQTTFNIARWMTSMVNMFGLNGSATPLDATIGWSGLDIPESARPALIAISNLRDLLRKKARSSSGISRDDIDDAISTSKDLFPASSSPPQPFTDVLQSFRQRLRNLAPPSSQDISKSVLSLCDTLRDADLWHKGIYLEDREGDRPALIRLVTKELLATRQEKEEREQAKAKAKAEREAEATAKADKGKVSERDIFRTEEFGAWDDDGVPTKDGKGEELTKSRTKKLRKEWERQKRLHEAWVKEHGSTS